MKLNQDKANGAYEDTSGGQDNDNTRNCNCNGDDNVYGIDNGNVDDDLQKVDRCARGNHHGECNAVDWLKGEYCIKCNSGSGKVLVCGENGCPIAFHEACMTWKPDFDDKGKFYCPYCFFKQEEDRIKEFRMKAISAGKELSDFICLRRDSGSEEKHEGEKPRNAEKSDEQTAHEFDNFENGENVEELDEHERVNLEGTSVLEMAKKTCSGDCRKGLNNDNPDKPQGVESINKEKSDEGSISRADGFENVGNEVKMEENIENSSDTDSPDLVSKTFVAGKKDDEQTGHSFDNVENGERIEEVEEDERVNMEVSRASKTEKKASSDDCQHGLKKDVKATSHHNPDETRGDESINKEKSDEGSISRYDGFANVGNEERILEYIKNSSVTEDDSPDLVSKTLVVDRKIDEQRADKAHPPNVVSTDKSSFQPSTSAKKTNMNREIKHVRVKISAGCRKSSEQLTISTMGGTEKRRRINRTAEENNMQKDLVHDFSSEVNKNMSDFICLRRDSGSEEKREGEKPMSEEKSDEQTAHGFDDIENGERVEKVEEDERVTLKGASLSETAKKVSSGDCGKRLNNDDKENLNPNHNKTQGVESINKEKSEASSKASKMEKKASSIDCQHGLKKDDKETSHHNPDETRGVESIHKEKSDEGSFSSDDGFANVGNEKRMQEDIKNSSGTEDDSPDLVSKTLVAGKKIYEQRADKAHPLNVVSTDKSSFQPSTSAKNTNMNGEGKTVRVKISAGRHKSSEQLTIPTMGGTEKRRRINRAAEENNMQKDLVHDLYSEVNKNTSDFICLRRDSGSEEKREGEKVEEDERVTFEGASVSEEAKKASSGDCGKRLINDDKENLHSNHDKTQGVESINKEKSDEGSISRADGFENVGNGERMEDNTENSSDTEDESPDLVSKMLVAGKKDDEKTCHRFDNVENGERIEEAEEDEKVTLEGASVSEMEKKVSSGDRGKRLNNDDKQNLHPNHDKTQGVESINKEKSDEESISRYDGFANVGNEERMLEYIKNSSGTEDDSLDLVSKTLVAGKMIDEQTADKAQPPNVVSTDKSSFQPSTSAKNTNMNREGKAVRVKISAGRRKSSEQLTISRMGGTEKRRRLNRTAEEDNMQKDLVHDFSSEVNKNMSDFIYLRRDSGTEEKWEGEKLTSQEKSDEQTAHGFDDVKDGERVEEVEKDERVTLEGASVSQMAKKVSSGDCGKRLNNDDKENLHPNNDKTQGVESINKEKYDEGSISRAYGFENVGNEGRMDENIENSSDTKDDSPDLVSKTLLAGKKDDEQTGHRFDNVEIQERIEEVEEDERVKREVSKASKLEKKASSIDCQHGLKKDDKETSHPNPDETRGVESINKEKSYEGSFSRDDGFANVGNEKRMQEDIKNSSGTEDDSPDLVSKTLVADKKIDEQRADKAHPHNVVSTDKPSFQPSTSAKNTNMNREGKTVRVKISAGRHKSSEQLTISIMNGIEKRRRLNRTAEEDNMQKDLVHDFSSEVNKNMSDFICLRRDTGSEEKRAGEKPMSKEISDGQTERWFDDVENGERVEKVEEDERVILEGASVSEEAKKASSGDCGKRLNNDDKENLHSNHDKTQRVESINKENSDEGSIYRADGFENVGNGERMEGNIENSSDTEDESCDLVSKTLVAGKKDDEQTGHRFDNVENGERIEKVEEYERVTLEGASVLETEKKASSGDRGKRLNNDDKQNLHLNHDKTQGVESINKEKSDEGSISRYDGFANVGNEERILEYIKNSSGTEDDSPNLVSKTLVAGKMIDEQTADKAQPPNVVSTDKSSFQPSTSAKHTNINREGKAVGVKISAGRRKSSEQLTISLMGGTEKRRRLNRTAEEDNMQKDLVHDFSSEVNKNMSDFIYLRRDSETEEKWEGEKPTSEEKSDEQTDHGFDDVKDGERVEEVEKDERVTLEGAGVSETAKKVSSGDCGKRLNNDDKENLHPNHVKTQCVESINKEKDDGFANVGNEKRMQEDIKISSGTEDDSHNLIAETLVVGQKHDKNTTNKAQPPKVVLPDKSSRQPSTSAKNANMNQEGKTVTVKISTGCQKSTRRPLIPITGGTEKRRRVHWTAEEEDMLKDLVQEFSMKVNKNIPWRKILEQGRSVFHSTRMPADLKDKWKNMVAKEISKG